MPPPFCTFPLLSCPFGAMGSEQHRCLPPPFFFPGSFQKDIAHVVVSILMLLQIIVTIVALASWLWYVQPRSAYIRRLYKVLQGPLQDMEVDYVIVGAGPGGLAAARCLLERDPNRSVLVIERGVDPSGAGPFTSILSLFEMHNLLSYAVDLLGSKFDSRWYVHRPLFHRTITKTDESMLTLYPRGCGVGGTSIIDWGLFMSPLPVKDNLTKIEGVDVPHSFTANRSPLSWGFAESVGTVLKKKYLSTFAKPQERNSVFPGFLRLDEDGRRLSLPNYLMRRQAPFLTVVEKSEVTGMVVKGQDTTVTGVICRAFNGCRFTVAVRRGVILSAGVIGTPRILREVFPLLQERFVVRDAIAVPLIMESFPGLSDDRRNIRCAKAHLGWWTARRGPFLNPVCDTIAAVDVPSLGPQAELVIFFLPFGGRDRIMYDRLGLDPTLGTFSEACTLLITLRGVDGIFFELGHTSENVKEAGTPPLTQPLFSVSSHHPLQQQHQEEKKKIFKGTVSSPFSTLSPTLMQEVVTAFVNGITLCRRIVAEKPLAYLLTQKEAVDVSLLDDPVRAIQYVKLTHTPPQKLTGRQQASAPEVFAWARESSRSQAYMEAYVHRHATWLGFGSGSCASVLSADDSLRVSGTRNVLIGDCSGVTEKMWNCGGCDTLRAGSVSTAMAMGTAAALELLSI